MPVGIVLHRKDFRTICNALRVAREQAKTGQAAELNDLSKRLRCERLLPGEVGEPPTKREALSPSAQPLSDPEGPPPARKD